MIKRYFKRLTEWKGTNYTLMFTVFIVIGIFALVLSIIYDDSSGGTNGLSSLTSNEEWKVEYNAIDDVLELGNIWGTPSTNELVCEAAGKTDDMIILAKCTTTFDELIQSFGSSTIWYGYLSSASGSTYWRAADADQAIVISKLRNR